MAESAIHTISPFLQIAYTLHRSTSPPATPRPTIILINGLADVKESWLTQVPAFTSAGYTVLTYDNRGVGASSRPMAAREVYTASDMAADLASLIKGVGITGPVHVLGTSMGGMIAQQFALDHVVQKQKEDDPSDLGIDVLSVTFACTYAAPGPFCTRMFELWSDMARRMSVSDVMRDVALWCFSPDFFANPARAEDVRAMDEDMAKIDDVAVGGMGLRGYLAQLNVILEFDSRAEIASLGNLADGGPEVVVLVGESDILIPVPLSRELHGLIPGAKWRTTKGGHACNWEYADEFNSTCLQMWEEVEGKR